MGWYDKQKKKEQLHRQIDQAMKDPRFIEMRNKERAQDVEKAFNCFMAISVDYLYRIENYGPKRMKRFIDFVNQSMKYVSEDEEYFLLLAKELEKETGVNVLLMSSSGNGGDNSEKINA